ncbi:MAG: iron ABC transporter permease [Rhizobiales bacterium]|nr:iron ABC transporter permease [Hyphomicrobiales bacterium]
MVSARAVAAGKGFGRLAVAALAVLGLLALAAASLAVGAARLAPAETWAGLVSGEGAAGLIVRDIRLPRLLLSLSVGATLGLCGAAMQGLLRNPLAEPAIFGAPQAAALGAVIVLYLGLAEATSLALPVAAIAGAGLSVAALLLIAGRRAGLVTLILAGLALSSLAGAATSLVINLSPNPFAVTEIVFWLMGSFEDRSLRHVVMAAPFLALACALLLTRARDYRALTLGEEAAASLGVDLARLRVLTVAGVAIGVGAGVAVSGAIGFVGLVAPYLARALVGGDPGRALAPSAFIGAMLLTAADVAVRLIPATSEIKVGVLTALIGVPLFLWLILGRRARGAEALA